MSEVPELPGLVERCEVWLERQPLSERTRREYSRQVAAFVEWLGAAPARGGDAFADSFARDYAVRDLQAATSSVRACLQQLQLDG
jgi:hypothetical protein